MTAVEWILRAIVSFVFLLLVAKFMGQRSISQLRFLDFIVALTLGNIIAHPLSDEKLGLTGSMITTAVLIVLYIAASWLGLKWPLLKSYLDPPPITLIKNGQINFHNLSSARLSIEFLFSELRKNHVADIQKVSLALWEPGGTLSVFMNTSEQPLTPADMKLDTQPFNLKRPIIIDGQMDSAVLKEIGKDAVWLEKKIAPAYTTIHDVRLALIDENENIQFYNR